jgi:hypothetical protein
MIKRILTIFVFTLLFAAMSIQPADAQVENVSLDDPVYSFLKRLSVRKIISSIHDYDPNLSKQQITDYLLEAKSKSSRLSETDRVLIEKYLVKFDVSMMNKSNTTALFDSHGRLDVKDIFSNKEKYFYILNSNGNTLFFDYLTSGLMSTEFKPNSKATSILYDFGGRFQGTFFGHLGYNFFLRKGVLGGNDSMLAVLNEPRLLYNFKFLENNPDDSERSFDFIDGYVRYETKPQDNMSVSVQLGREKLLYGYSYTDPLALGGAHPNMDFIKMKFDYGIAHFSSITASTVGPYSQTRDSNYTKFIAFNSLRFSIPNLFDIGIGESVVYSRGIDIGYLTPFIFYKFVEHSLQDRDNGTLFFDIQTHFIKDLQFQGTFFMDESLFGGLTEFNKQTNKVAFQLGSMWTEPVGVKDVSLTLQYTYIRPYVYTHFNPKNTYTSFGQVLGNPIGPNADQIYSRLTYDFSDWLSVSFVYERIRKGENVYDASGSLVKNVGGDANQTFREGLDSDVANFLDGNRVNTDVAQVSLKIEPFRNFIFDINYIYRKENHLDQNFIDDVNFGSIKLSIDY